MISIFRMTTRNWHTLILCTKKEILHFLALQKLNAMESFILYSDTWRLKLSCIVLNSLWNSNHFLHKSKRSTFHGNSFFTGLMHNCLLGLIPQTGPRYWKENLFYGPPYLWALMGFFCQLSAFAFHKVNR